MKYTIKHENIHIKMKIALGNDNNDLNSRHHLSASMPNYQASFKGSRVYTISHLLI